MNDPRIAALAEALHAASPLHHNDGKHHIDCDRDAAAILAALPPDWCGHDSIDIGPLVEQMRRAERAELEIARLRKIKEAGKRLACYADAASDCPYPMHDPEKCDHRAILRDEVALFRAALEADR